MPPIVADNWADGRCPLGYRSSRLSSTVPTTEATTENRIISRQPGQPPRGRIWIRPGRMGWLLRFRVADRSPMALVRSLTIGGPATRDGMTAWPGRGAGCSPAMPSDQLSSMPWCAGGSGRRGLGRSAWRLGRGPGRAPGCSACRSRRRWLPRLIAPRRTPDSTPRGQFRSRYATAALADEAGSKYSRGGLLVSGRSGWWPPSRTP